jgi:hypothetical protein
MNTNVSVMGISGHLLGSGGINQPGESPRGRFFSEGKHHILYGSNMIIRRVTLNYETFDENGRRRE